jgi:hypothetical protein
MSTFRSHVERGTWTLVPMSEPLLWDVHEALRILATRFTSARAMPLTWCPPGLPALRRFGRTIVTSSKPPVISTSAGEAPDRHRGGGQKILSHYYLRLAHHIRPKKIFSDM